MWNQLQLVFSLIFCLFKVFAVESTCLGNERTFDQFIEGATELRWVTVLDTRFAFDRAHPDSNIAEVLECDPNDCLSCTFIRNVVNLFYLNADEDCYKFDSDSTYLVATNTQHSGPDFLGSDDMTQPPVQIQPYEWLVFRQLCAFKKQSLFRGYRVQEPSSCLNVDLSPFLVYEGGCIPGNVTLAELKNLADKYKGYVPPEAQTCLQSRDLFSERLAFAGAASIVTNVNGELATNGFFKKITSKVCDSLCLFWVKLPPVNESCKPSFGNFANLQLEVSPELSCQVPKTTSPCYYFAGDWPKYSTNPYLVFHTPYRCDTTFPNVWIIGEPVEVTDYIWQGLSQLCYFTSEECDTCKTDMKLPQIFKPTTTTIAPTTTTRTTTIPTTTPKAAGYAHEVCNPDSLCPQSSDCLSERMAISSDVFLGSEARPTNNEDFYTIDVECPLKGSANGSILVKGFSDASDAPCTSPNLAIIPGVYIHFITKSEDGANYTVATDSVPAETDDAWNLSRMQCGLTLPPGNTGEKCSAIVTDANCLHDVSVKEIEAVNYPHQSCASDMHPRSDCPPAFSDCLGERLETTGELVFFGKVISVPIVNRTDYYTISVECFLKGFHVGPTVDVFIPTPGAACPSITPTFQVDDRRIFFVKTGPLVKRFELSAMPVLVTLGDAGSNLALKQCGITPQSTSSANDDVCLAGKLAVGCLSDVSVDEIEAMSETTDSTPKSYTTTTQHFAPTEIGCVNRPTGPRVCDSEWLMDRFNASTEVFWGKAVHRGTVMVFCWLKRGEKFPNAGAMAFTYPLPACGSQFDGFVDDESSTYLFFSHFADEPYVATFKGTAVPIKIEYLESWNLVKQLCGTNPSLPDYIDPDPQFQMPFGECSSSKLKCFCNISVADITTPPVTTSIAPVTDPPKLEIGCENKTVAARACDSDLLADRFDVSTDVFWGRAINATSAKVFCYLKRNVLSISETEILLVDSAEQCGDVPAVDENSEYLFFLNSSALSAVPVKIDNFESWESVKQFCGATLELPDGADSATFPLGDCINLEPTCYCNTSVSALPSGSSTRVVRSLAAKTDAAPSCAELDDSLARRFTIAGRLTNESKPALVWATIEETLQSYYDLNLHCTLSQSEVTLSKQTVLFAPVGRPCFPFCIRGESSDVKYLILVSTDHYDIETSNNITALAEPIEIEEQQALLTVERLCLLRRFKNMALKGDKCDGNITSDIAGCFFDLSAAMLSPLVSLDLTAIGERCKDMSSDLLKGRMDLAAYVAWGRVTSINYSNRSFTFASSCFLKSSGNLPVNTFEVHISAETDGCFLIDDDSVSRNETFLIFLDKDLKMSAREIMANESHLSIFSSSCDTMVIKSAYSSCPRNLDRELSCYANVTISDVLLNVPLQVQTVIEAFCQSIYTNFSEVQSAADEVVWATVSGIVTLTTAELDPRGDRLLAVGLKPHCLIKSTGLITSALVKTSILTSSLHVSSDYIFAVRKTIASPWHEVSYELVAPPVPASQRVWRQMSASCFVHASGTVLPEAGGRCGEPITYNNQTNECSADDALDLDEENIFCPGKSDDFADRVNPGNHVTIALWGESTAINYRLDNELSPKKNESLSKAVPLSIPVGGKKIWEITFRSFCQISGAEKPPSVITVKYHEVDCFHSNNIVIAQGQRYLIFVNAQSYILDAAPILANETSIKIVGTSCDISPPEWAILDDDIGKDVCPTSQTPPPLCSAYVSVNRIAMHLPLPTANASLDWWAIMLIVLAVVAVLAGTTSYFLYRRKASSRRLEHHFLSELDNEFSESPSDRIYESRRDAPPAGTSDLTMEPIRRVLHAAFSDDAASDEAEEFMQSSRTRLISKDATGSSNQVVEKSAQKRTTEQARALHGSYPNVTGGGDSGTNQNANMQNPSRIIRSDGMLIHIADEL